MNDSGWLGAPKERARGDIEERVLALADQERRRVAGGHELELARVGYEAGDEQCRDLDVLTELGQEAVEPYQQVGQIVVDARVRRVSRDGASPSAAPSSSRARSRRRRRA